MISQPYVLQVEELTVKFDGFTAVNALSMYVDRNELRALIGPNGAGKTTLLDLISGKTKPTSGRVAFKGEDITHFREHEIVSAGIGRKFQTPSVYGELTVFENLELSYPASRSWFGAWTFKRTPEIIARVEEVASMIFLEERLHDRAENLSHGQKQWLEIGSLIISDADLMMLDEPVAGMSVHERKKTAELLLKLCETHAVIVVEHDMQFVEEIAHRVTVLHQGRVLAEGKMDEVQRNPEVIDVYLGH